MMQSVNRMESQRVSMKFVDKLALKEEKWLKPRLGSNEKVLFRSNINKHNNKGIIQQRVLLITTEYIYNIAYEDFLVKLLSVMDSSSAIKRKIPIELVSAFTVSCHPTSDEFVVHVEKQHDYRYSAEERTKEAALSAICLAFRLKTGRKVPFHFKEEADLGRFQTHEKDVKKNISRRPMDAALHLSDQDLTFGLEFFAKSRKEITKNYLASRNSITSKTQIGITLVKERSDASTNCSDPDGRSPESMKSRSVGNFDSPTNSQSFSQKCDVSTTLIQDAQPEMGCSRNK